MKKKDKNMSIIELRNLYLSLFQIYFSQNSEARQFLSSTKNNIIFVLDHEKYSKMPESTKKDTVATINENKVIGKNIIGEILVEIRDKLIEDDTNTHEDKLELFFSGAKNHKGDSMGGEKEWRKYLSNFQSLPNGLQWDNNYFPNLEHAFHYEKFKRSTKPELRNKYVGKESNFNSNAKARSHSGKGSMKNLNVTLNVKKWDKERIEVQKNLLIARFDQDLTFRNILKDLNEKNIKLYHHMRGTLRNPPFWGAFMSNKEESQGKLIGENMLGKQIMNLMKDKFE